MWAAIHFRTESSRFFPMWRAYEGADRCDADLMLWLATCVPSALWWLKLQQAFEDPGDWHAVLMRNPDGSYTDLLE